MLHKALDAESKAAMTEQGCGHCGLAMTKASALNFLKS